MVDFDCMSGNISELSVFFPAYNEETNIKKTVLNAKKVLENIGISRWEIIVVNDGSSDKTGEIAVKLRKKDKRIRVINHSSNRGYGAALKSGLYNSRYNWIAFTDSDGQFDFSEISNFLGKQKETGADIVVGYYKKRRVKKSIILTSKIWEAFIYVLFGLKVRDIDCGFKLLSKNVVNRIDHLESERGAFISSELLLKAKNAGFKIVELPVNHYPRAGGEATGRKLNVIIQSFIDLFKLRVKLIRGRSV